MYCQQAKELIDQRVQAGGDESAARDWSELDAHLAKCPECSALLLQLMRTRNLLAGLAGDEPTDQETAKMWQAIQPIGPAGALVLHASSIRKRAIRFVAACAGIAAVLTIALMIGRQYERQVRVASTVKALQGVATPSVRDDVTADGVSDSVTFSLARPASRARTIPARKTPARPSGDMQKLESLGHFREALRSFEQTDPSSGATNVEYHPAARPSPPALSEPADRLMETAIAGIGPIMNGLVSVRLQSPLDQDQNLAAEFRQEEIRTAFTKAREANSGDRAPKKKGAKRPARRGASTAEEPLDSRDRAGSGQQNTRPDQKPSTPRQPLQAHPKIIKTGELTLEVAAYDEAAAEVDGVVKQAGGFVADVVVKEQAGGALAGTVVIRVPPERFEGLFAALKKVGRVEAENVKAADVTAQYVDLEARIRGLQITEERLSELIQSKSFIDKIESLLEVEREMTRVRSQIEQLQGQLRVMANRVAMSTITVTLREPARKVPSASMSVEVRTVAEASAALGEALEELGGRLRSGKTSKRSDGTLRGDYKLEVSLARFGQMLAAVESLGRVEERQVTDRQFSHASQPWADQVQCFVALVLYERPQQPPRGTVHLEVDDLAAARGGLDGLLVPCGGAVMSSKTIRRGDGSSVGELRLRVSAGRFAEAIESLGSLGRTVAKETAGASGEIVGGAANLPCDINLTLAEPARQIPSGSMAIEVQAFQTARQQLSSLIADNEVQVLGSSSNQRTDGTWTGGFRLGIKAGDMDSVVTRLESFGRVASRQITGIGLGDLSRADPDALGVIELTLAEKSAIAPEPHRAGDSIRSRLRDGLAGFYNSLGLIAYGLMAMAPWLIIVAALALIALWLRRRAKPVPERVTPPPMTGS